MQAWQKSLNVHEVRMLCKPYHNGWQQAQGELDLLNKGQHLVVAQDGKNAIPA